MHIPDAFIPLDQAIVYWIIVIPFIALSIRWARQEMDDMKIPLLAALAAGIFAIQAMNIPVGMGTSGHMVGAVLAAIILGSPWAGVLLLTLVLFVQALGFADGGVTTLGANILNMGLISGFVGYYTFIGLKKIKLSMPIAAFGGAWLGLFISSIACLLEMTLAGTFPLVPGLIAMGTYHAIIGVIGEGAITAVAVSAIAQARPDLLSQFSDEAVTT
ncbi:MAG: cobalt transporter CbiM [Methanosarcinaceae archaeon]|nr:cobalt transporter CbiM [Methanosarcinaceae archaeon]MDF1534620.1 cobalt transporter CbiM [Methanosarcinaceae archaeon]